MIIKSNEDAWALLELQLDEKELVEFEFAAWPVLDIKLSGDDYESSLNTGQMSALVDLTDVLGRTYAVIAHGAYDMRRLKDDEEEQLKCTTKVKKGSSILETDFTALVQGFANAVTEHPQVALISALILGLAFVSRPVLLKHFENKAKQLDLEDKKLLLQAMKPQQGDIERLSLLDKAVGRVTAVYPQFSQAIPDVREAFWRFAASSVDADSMNIDGLVLRQDDLELLANRRARRSRDKKFIKEVCTITYVKKVSNHYLVGLQAKNLTLGAKYTKPQLTQARIKKLFNLMSSDQQIEAGIEVRTADSSQLSGRLISFKPKV